ncbi:MAG: type II toxin-antitoxin system RelE/ParE family toxin [Candidatus Thermoplasmatota archaeon]|nr:type II toxin-antitoxin system RelE/ParE family toxin [Candidatus Thermoplasmatota archaeon]
MGYQVLLHPRANAFLESIEGELKNRIRKKLHALNSNPEKGEKLKYSDFWRLRIGDYRAVYEIDHNNNRVIILFIGHRREVYDDFSRLF